MKINKILYVIILCICANQVKAQRFKFQPTLSIFESYTLFNNYSVLNAGLFDLENRKLNVGFELTHKIYIQSSYFLRFGVRYQHFKKNVYAINQVPELYDYPRPFYWEHRYSAFSIPIHFGKDYYINSMKKGDFYFGFTLGILMTSYFKGGWTQPQPRESSFTDPVFYNQWGEPNQNANFFYPNIEAGVNFIPLNNFNKLSVGFNISAQLNKTGETKHLASVEVPTKDYDFFYDLYNKNRIINFSISLGYTF